ncbi:MAG: PfaD family polyunsaturated fatty acid/polyketide biosynthesis protein [Gemmataceae bacterium]
MNDIETIDRRLTIGNATVPAILPHDLGDRVWRAELGLRYAYVTGSMANGIASAELVEAISRAGMLGFFGAAGLSSQRVRQAIDRLQSTLGQQPFGFNLIHSPNEPRLEAEVAELYHTRGVRLVEASAYLDLTLPLVRYRLRGIYAGPDGQVICPNRVIAKVSRIEVATRFFSPPPERMLAELVREGTLTPTQAQLAQRVPVAQDITAEADSGGHTDNRPSITLIPTLLALRDRMQPRYTIPLRVGAAGGIATPEAVAAAFQMGAAYVVTGSINQACRESGSSDAVREMLAQAEQADVIMAPAADMFEMGVKLQVLKRGTLFAMRAARLYECYRNYPSLEAIPTAERETLEKTIFRAPLETIWAETQTFWRERDPQQLERAAHEPKHRMALVFRWYLGLSSRWANAGEPTRRMDYQVWCGPAMGAFNEWTRGSYLEDWRNRYVADVARNLLWGACVRTRQHFLRLQGVPADEPVRPRRGLEELFP